MMAELGGAYCAVSIMFHISNISLLRLGYFAYFHSVINMGQFGGNSSDSKAVFILQK
jgi:hypothetical protein